MKRTFNASYGIDTIVIGKDGKKKWYQWERFPLIPIAVFNRADDWNEANFNFSWLNLRIWSLSSPSIGLQIMVEDIGIYAKFFLPYLIMVIWVLPFPESWYMKFWRKGLKEYNEPMEWPNSKQ